MPYPFSERWFLRFTLTTAGPLHLGDGHVKTAASQRSAGDQRFAGEDTVPEYDTVFTAYDHKPAIPGASLKGVLRAWMESGASREALLGSEDTSHAGTDKKNRAGGLSIFDGRSGVFPPAGAAGPENWTAPPRWDRERQTGIAVSVSLNRTTRTVDEGRLFYYEFVPAGVPFTFEMGAERVTEADIESLVAALHAFNDPVRPMRLGAHTSSGWGGMRFDPASLHIWKLDSEGVKKWIAAGSEGAGWGIVEKYGTSVPEDSSVFEDSLPGYASKQNSLDYVRIPFIVRFEGPFLVNDPSQCMTKKLRRDRSRQEEYGYRQDKPGHAPRLNPDGSVDLPSRSVRGALASRVERILRTQGVACVTPADSPPAIQTVDSLNAGENNPVLDPARRLFGTGGWRGALEIGAFTQIGTSILMESTSVAIDRFTQAAADKKLFTTRAAWQPVFSGSLAVDLARLRKAGDPVIPLRALLWALRDWMDGDFTIGYGASKGFGTCRAEIQLDDFQRLLDLLPKFSPL